MKIIRELLSQFPIAGQVFEEDVIITPEKIVSYLNSRPNTAATLDEDSNKISVVGDVVVHPNWVKNGKLSIDFSRVDGLFFASNCNLKSLKGFPYWIGKELILNNNSIKNFIDGPSYVGGDLIIRNNKLVSFDGAPSKIAGNLDITNNKTLISLHAISKNIKSMDGVLILSPKYIKKDILGIMLIPGLGDVCDGDNPGKPRSINKMYLDFAVKGHTESYEPFEIVTRHTKVSKDITDCQDELFDANYLEYAKI